MIAFTGSDAGNTAAQNEIVNRLNAVTTANGATVEVIVVGADKIGNKGVAAVHLAAGGYQSICQTDTSCGELGGDNAWVDTSIADRGDVGAHEILHTAGAADGYQGSTGVAGVGAGRSAPTSFNRPQSDIMSTRTGTDLGTQSLSEIQGDAIQKPNQANRNVCRSSPGYAGC